MAMPLAAPRQDQRTARRYASAVLAIAPLLLVFYLVDTWRSPGEPFMERYREVAFTFALAALAGSVRIGTGPRARPLLLLAWGFLAFAVIGLISALRNWF